MLGHPANTVITWFLLEQKGWITHVTLKTVLKRGPYRPGLDQQYLRGAKLYYSFFYVKNNKMFSV